MTDNQDMKESKKKPGEYFYQITLSIQKCRTANENEIDYIGGARKTTLVSGAHPLVFKEAIDRLRDEMVDYHE